MRNVLYTCFVLLLVSCFNQNKPKKPDNLISKDKMVRVIVDMSVYSSAKGVNKKVLEEKGVKLQEYIYEKHNIDSAQFAASNYYYTYNPETYEDIYKQVRDSLTKLKAEYTALDKIETKEKKRKDSLKRTKLKLMPEKGASLKDSVTSAAFNKNKKALLKKN
ncbi:MULTISPECIES: DUF4296 domain-containing protein [unclassified Lacinutrix]